MDISTLLHSLTTQGLSLSLGESGSIVVAGPVASLTMEQQRALSTHKQTLLSMLTPPLSCYLPEDLQGDDDADEDLSPLYRGMEYFSRLADATAKHWPERRSQIVQEPGLQESPCRRCGSRSTYLAIIHAGESLRRDCATCGRFIDFPSWHNRNETAKILADAVAGTRYDKEASCPSASNTQARSNDNLSLTKETANG